MLMEGMGTNTPANDYTYNGKELNEDFALNWYDYGARWYDASLGRWWSVDPMGEGTVSISNYAYVSNSPMILIDPSGMYQLTYGVGGYSSPSEWANAKAEEFNNKRNAYREEKKQAENKTKVNINVTDEVVGEGYVYADGQLNTDEYFAVNIYKMTVSFVDAEGESISQDFEVLKYGVKYNAGTDEYYYQGFGGGATTSETTIENPTFDAGYTYGGFNLYAGGLYDLHPQHTTIRDIPSGTGGRVNKGCIGVCGSKKDGWGGVTDLLFQAAGMTDKIGETQLNKKRALSSMLSKIDLKITIAAFSIPTTSPPPIKK
jgi:RHS repeat-associated protein